MRIRICGKFLELRGCWFGDFVLSIVGTDGDFLVSDGRGCGVFMWGIRFFK